MTANYRHTPGPWRQPYLDTLPNGIRAVRIDSPHDSGVSIVALLPIGPTVTADPEITAIQQANSALVAAAPDLLAVVREYAENIISDPEDGSYRACCGAPYRYWPHDTEGNPHAQGCAAIAAITKAEGRNV